jgi:integrase
MAPRRVDWREPAWFAPEQVERILRTAEAHPGPAEAGIGAYLALGFLAGVRTAEILRARWEDRDLEGGVLRIPQPKGVTRGRRPRLVELEPSAVAWLRNWRDWTAEHRGGVAAGRIVRDEHGIRDWKARRFARTDAWRRGAAQNVARHTYATMHVAAFRNAAATALNLGHGSSTEMLERHYRGLVPRSVAEAYWRILPSPEPLPPPEPTPGRGYRSDLHGPGRRP